MSNTKNRLQEIADGFLRLKFWSKNKMNMENALPDQEDEDFDELIRNQEEWEDQQAYQEIIDKMPNGWYMIKVTNYNAQKLKDIDEWCVENCSGEYKRIGWNSDCAYSVGVQFKESRDAVFFRLMWSS